jgi:hypothetical protein
MSLTLLGVTYLFLIPGNHNNIIEKSGLKWSFYKYYNAKTMGFDLEGMLSDLSNMKPGTHQIYPFFSKIPISPFMHRLQYLSIH